MSDSTTAPEDGVTTEKDQKPWQEMSDDELISYAIELDKRKRDLSDELEPIESKLKAMQDRLVDIFEKTGNQSVSRLGMTMYLKRELWIYSGDDKVAATAALRAAKLGDFVKEDFNVQSISAYGRELERESATEEEPFHPEAILEKHPELRGKLNPTEKHKVVIIKGRGG